MSPERRWQVVEGVPGDLCVRSTGPSREAVFAAAADALLAATVQEPERVGARTTRRLELREADLELLLLRFLNELIYLRDAEQLLLRPHRLELVDDGAFTLRAELSGEPLDPARHELTGEVKATTAHRLRVAPTASGWEATVTFDL